MDINYQLDILRDTYSDENGLAQILGKLVDAVLSRERLRLGRYEHDLRQFELRYGMESAVFYRRFEAGELGDAMDFFEWSGLYDLYQRAQEKVRRLEQAA